MSANADHTGAEFHAEHLLNLAILARRDIAAHNYEAALNSLQSLPGFASLASWYSTRCRDSQIAARLGLASGNAECDQCEAVTWLAPEHNAHDDETLCGQCLELRAGRAYHAPSDCPDDCDRDHRAEADSARSELLREMSEE